MTHDRANEIATACEDAFSFPRYVAGEWAASARTLADLGFRESQIEWVLRSKHTRWSADSAPKGKGTAYALAMYLAHNKMTPESVSNEMQGD